MMYVYISSVSEGNTRCSLYLVITYGGDLWSLHSFFQTGIPVFCDVYFSRILAPVLL